MTLAGLAGLSRLPPPPHPACGDYHWIGAAGSGQRDGAGLTANGGMGAVVFQSYQQLQAELLANGRTITAEAVQYPAAPVPLEGGLGGWMDFMDSVKDGADATAEQFEAFTERCPDTKVVLAGYSQGAMVIHRNLYDLADDPHVAAALLIADGDRLPDDTTINMGSAAAVPARAWAWLRSIPSWHPPTPRSCRQRSARALSASAISAIRSATTTPIRPTTSPAGIAIHTSYAPAASGSHAWGAPLYNLVASAGPAPTSTIELTARGD